jgi:antitoxin ParD1/3/4
MAKTINLNVRVSGELGDFIAGKISQSGDFESTSEYVRSLIRRDKEQNEEVAFQRLKAELKLAFSASDDSYEPLTAEEVIARNPAKK